MMLLSDAVRWFGALLLSLFPPSSGGVWSAIRQDEKIPLTVLNINASESTEYVLLIPVLVQYCTVRLHYATHTVRFSSFYFISAISFCKKTKQSTHSQQPSLLIPPQLLATVSEFYYNYHFSSSSNSSSYLDLESPWREDHVP